VQVWYAPFAGGAPTLVSDGDWPVISPDKSGMRLWFKPA
jgi:hypothetical protein